MEHVILLRKKRVYLVIIHHYAVGLIDEQTLYTELSECAQVSDKRLLYEIGKLAQSAMP